MNASNYRHAIVALGIQGLTAVPLTGLGLLLGVSFPEAFCLSLWAGGIGGSYAFISREHAHEQVDIKIRTGVSVEDQNPFRGFDWSDRDRWLDALSPLVANNTVSIAGTIFAVVV